jgi:hypothetical protein
MDRMRGGWERAGDGALGVARISCQNLRRFSFFEDQLATSFTAAFANNSIKQGSDDMQQHINLGTMETWRLYT